jgi:hypothetical protein
MIMYPTLFPGVHAGVSVELSECVSVEDGVDVAFGVMTLTEVVVIVLVEFCAPTVNKKIYSNHQLP